LVSGGVLIFVDESAEQVDAFDPLCWTARYGQWRLWHGEIQADWPAWRPFGRA
jgi:hypothetical protein